MIMFQIGECERRPSLFESNPYHCLNSTPLWQVNQESLQLTITRDNSKILLTGTMAAANITLSNFVSQSSKLLRWSRFYPLLGKAKIRKSRAPRKFSFDAYIFSMTNKRNEAYCNQSKSVNFMQNRKTNFLLPRLPIYELKMYESMEISTKSSNCMKSRAMYDKVVKVQSDYRG